jgi:hypothetical protein
MAIVWCDSRPIGETGRQISVVAQGRAVRVALSSGQASTVGMQAISEIQSACIVSTTSGLPFGCVVALGCVPPAACVVLVTLRWEGDDDEPRGAVVGTCKVVMGDGMYPLTLCAASPRVGLVSCSDQSWGCFSSDGKSAALQLSEPLPDRFTVVREWPDRSGPWFMARSASVGETGVCLALAVPPDPPTALLGGSAVPLLHDPVPKLNAPREWQARASSSWPGTQASVVLWRRSDEGLRLVSCKVTVRTEVSFARTFLYMQTLKPGSSTETGLSHRRLLDAQPLPGPGCLAAVVMEGGVAMVDVTPSVRGLLSSCEEGTCPVLSWISSLNPVVPSSLPNMEAERAVLGDAVLADASLRLVRPAMLRDGRVLVGAIRLASCVEHVWQQAEQVTLWELTRATTTTSEVAPLAGGLVMEPHELSLPDLPLAHLPPAPSAQAASSSSSSTTMEDQPASLEAVPRDTFLSAMQRLRERMPALSKPAALATDWEPVEFRTGWRHCVVWSQTWLKRVPPQSVPGRGVISLGVILPEGSPRILTSNGLSELLLVGAASFLKLPLRLEGDRPHLELSAHAHNDMLPTLPRAEPSIRTSVLRCLALGVSASQETLVRPRLQRVWAETTRHPQPHPPTGVMMSDGVVQEIDPLRLSPRSNLPARGPEGIRPPLLSVRTPWVSTSPRVRRSWDFSSSQETLRLGNVAVVRRLAQLRRAGFHAGYQAVHEVLVDEFRDARAKRPTRTFQGGLASSLLAPHASLYRAPPNPPVWVSPLLVKGSTDDAISLQCAPGAGALVACIPSTRSSLGWDANGRYRFPRPQESFPLHVTNRSHLGYRGHLVLSELFLRQHMARADASWLLTPILVPRAPLPALAAAQTRQPGVMLLRPALGDADPFAAVRTQLRDQFVQSYSVPEAADSVTNAWNRLHHRSESTVEEVLSNRPMYVGTVVSATGVLPSRPCVSLEEAAALTRPPPLNRVVQLLEPDEPPQEAEPALRESLDEDWCPDLVPDLSVREAFAQRGDAGGVVVQGLEPRNLWDLGWRQAVRTLRQALVEPKSAPEDVVTAQTSQSLMDQLAAMLSSVK